MSLTSGGTPEPIAFVKSNSFNAASDKFDVTAFGDNQKVYVAGLSDASGSFAFWYDDATTQTYSAAVDGVARKFYFYPDFVNSPSVYWYGSWFIDFSITVDVSGAIDGTATWNAGSIVNKSTA
jgi:hypothetical protein